MQWSTLIEKAMSGDIQTMSRLISAVENRQTGWITAMKEIFPHTGKSKIIGITGAPGAGKSTLTGKLAQHYVSQGLRIAVIAIDPSSPFSGGALLGDRIRMQNLGEKTFFTRSMASRGALGGLSEAVVDVLRILDACGFEKILIETVGVGQAEVKIYPLADTVAVVFVPGQGDEIQALKAGIMEIADSFIVNKADRNGADDVVANLKLAIDLMAPGQPAPPILKAVSTTGEGIAEIARTLDTRLMTSHAKKPHRNAQEEIYDLYENALKNLFWRKLKVIEIIKAATNKETPVNPYQIVDEMIPIKQISEYLQHGFED
jgi:GTPase